VHALVAARLQPRLKNLSHYEQVQKFTLLDREFSVEHEEVTLTMKLRRAQINKSFAAEIERMYAT
jgi:long-chain acyl-CoA synthetase